MQNRPRQVIILTGSNGLIGSAIMQRMKERWQIVGFDHDGQPQPPPEVENVCVDLTHPHSVELGLKRTAYAYGQKIAAVVHLAAYYSFSGEDSPLYDKVTVQGTRRLLTELRDQRFDVERFIFSSTMLVHAATQPGQPINEQSPIEGKWAYPQSKIKTEQVMREVHGDIPITMLRIAGVYTDDCDSIPIAHQIQRIDQNWMTSHVYPADISHGQAFVHLDDLITAFERTIEHRRDQASEEAFLIGEPETYSYDQRQKTLGQALHGEPDWTTEQIPKAVAKTGAWVQGKIPGMEEPFIKPWMIDIADDHYELDITKARQKLGWEPKHRLIDTLPKMVEALKRDPAAWYRHHKMDPPEEAVEASKQRNQ